MKRYTILGTRNEEGHRHEVEEIANKQGRWVKYDDIINTWRDWVDKHGRLSLMIKDLLSKLNREQIKVSELEEENSRLKVSNNKLIKSLGDLKELSYELDIYGSVIKTIEDALSESGEVGIVNENNHRSN